MNVYKCDQCSSVFTDSSNLRRHKRSFHSNKKNFKCERCNLTFTRSDHLKRHYNRHNKVIKLLHCNFNGCKRAFTNPDKLEIHRKLHVKKLEEDVIMIKGFSVSKKIENKSTILSCPYKDCNKNYNSYSGITKHLQTHLDPPKPTEHSDIIPLPCDKCKKTFKTKQGLEHHLSNKHQPTNSNDRVVFVCPYEGCRKIYTTKSNLNMHVARNHTNNINFKCDDCGRSFKWKKTLKLHKCKATNHSL